jgi:hypothetical protein
VQGELVLRWLEGYIAFSKANRAPSSIWSPELHMEPSVYGLIIRYIKYTKYFIINNIIIGL